MAKLFLDLEDAVNVAMAKFDIAEEDREWIRSEFEQKCYISTSEYDIGYDDGLEAASNAIQRVADERYKKWFEGNQSKGSESVEAPKRDCESCKHYVEKDGQGVYGCELWQCDYERKGLIEVSRVESCATCESCKTDYTGLVDDDGQIRLAKLGEPVCTVGIDVYGEDVVALGDTNGMCELYTERKEE